MGAVRRLLFHFAAAVSLLVAMVIIFFSLRVHWIADYFVLPDRVKVRTTRSGWQVSQFDARSYYAWPPPTAHGTLPRGIDDADQPLWERQRYENGDVQLRILGFRFWRITADKWVGSQRHGYMWHPSWGLTIPHWALLLLASILPIQWWRRWRRAEPGMCVKCGYDLRGSRDHCPECGTAFVAVAVPVVPVAQPPQSSQPPQPPRE